MVDKNECPFAQPQAHMTDDEYFAALTGEVFRMVIGTEPVVKRWPEITRAFDNFSIEKVAEFSESDVQRLLANAGIIRNRKKIEATILNARAFRAIQQEYRSLESYIRSFNGDIDRIVEELAARLHYTGAPSIRRFLRCVGVRAGQEAK